MSDLIRRQDAELILAREMFATSLMGGCDPVSPMDFLPEARAWLSDAPTIGGWIPCSDCERRCDKWENLKTSQE